MRVLVILHPRLVFFIPADAPPLTNRRPNRYKWECSTNKSDKPLNPSFLGVEEATLHVEVDFKSSCVDVVCHVCVVI